jgi:hypothetical protein
MIFPYMLLMCPGLAHPHHYSICITFSSSIQHLIVEPEDMVGNIGWFIGSVIPYHKLLQTQWLWNNTHFLVMQVRSSTQHR